MNWNHWIRQVHRWMAIAFTAGFVFNIVMMSGGQEPAYWVYFTVLIPLFVLFPTGLYMYVQPHAMRWRSARRISEAE